MRLAASVNGTLGSAGDFAELNRFVPPPSVLLELEKNVSKGRMLEILSAPAMRAVAVQAHASPATGSLKFHDGWVTEAEVKDARKDLPAIRLLILGSCGSEELVGDLIKDEGVAVYTEKVWSPSYATKIRKWLEAAIDNPDEPISILWDKVNPRKGILKFSGSNTLTASQVFAKTKLREVLSAISHYMGHKKSTKTVLYLIQDYMER